LPGRRVIGVAGDGWINLVADASGDLSDRRRSYERGRLDEADVAEGWLPLFRAWYAEAERERGVIEANAMQVATVDAAGHPTVRTVLAKQVDEDGVVFYTNYDSAKAHDLAVAPMAALVFAWVPLERQVRISGSVERVDAETSAAYFGTRPRDSQIAAWASHQSAELRDRAELVAAVAAVERKFKGRGVPLPPDWGGYRVIPELVEFWAGRPNRLHDRLEGRRDVAGWHWRRLAP
jgi:pyridoxamine 5'-phosphate oxidase